MGWITYSVNEVQPPANRTPSTFWPLKVWWYRPQKTCESTLAQIWVLGLTLKTHSAYGLAPHSPSAVYTYKIDPGHWEGSHRTVGVSNQIIPSNVRILSCLSHNCIYFAENPPQKIRLAENPHKSEISQPKRPTKYKIRLRGLDTPQLGKCVGIMFTIDSTNINMSWITYPQHEPNPFHHYISTSIGITECGNVSHWHTAEMAGGSVVGDIVYYK